MLFRSGDMDGSAFTGHLRLPNDPCSDGWAEFLLPKLLLWMFGVTSITMMAYSRILLSKIPNGDSSLTMNEVIYIFSALIHGSTIFMWTLLIIVALYVTGEKLKAEPFLGTRPAQLAYRVLFAHSALAIVALVISSINYIEQLQGVLHGQGIVAIVKQGDVEFSGMCKASARQTPSEAPLIGRPT